MTNSTIELNQDLNLAVRAVLIQHDVRYLHEKISRLENLIEWLGDKSSQNYRSLYEKINSVECRVISRS